MASPYKERISFHTVPAVFILATASISHPRRRVFHFCRRYRISDNKILDLSFEFAVEVVTIADSIKVPKSTYMLDQFARAGTSIGANVHEAQYAQSRKDFASKMGIALKEANETHYWLKLMNATGRLDDQTFRRVNRMCGNLRRMLISSCTTVKKETDE